MGCRERFYADIMAMHPEVTGSCNLVIVKLPNGETIRFVVDCGLFHEKDYEEYNYSLPFKPDAVDFCLVTHNHVDHTGRLPFMVKKGYENKIYATSDTCQLMPLALLDSLKVLKDIAKRKNQKCLYNETDVDKTIDNLVRCKYNEIIQVNEYVRVTFFPNGHLQGAALIFVTVSCEGENINMLFTGDYNNKNIFFDLQPLPYWVLEVPLTIIQEATYGNMDSEEIIPVFENNLLECLSNGGTVVAPVFSLGRAQEALYVLKCMQDRGVLDPNIPIYLDGKLALKYTDLFVKKKLNIKEEMQDFLPRNLEYISKATRDFILVDKNVKIILTTSGMGSYGPAQMYIPEYITRSNALIHFMGYTAEDTLGAKLKDTEVGEIVEIGGTLLKKRAKVVYTTEFSAHAKADEMIDFLNQFTDLKFVLVNHGETDTKSVFAERILNEVNVKSVGILGREYFFRINPNGFVKSFSSKFV